MERASKRVMDRHGSYGKGMECVRERERERESFQSGSCFPDPLVTRDDLPWRHTLSVAACDPGVEVAFCCGIGDDLPWFVKGVGVGV